ncbi:hypothetical protein JOF56_003013 [Kibdelosporangium banguiense]|uniref:Uncharacterized protein n=1 Tax=Kibdelosporangium banguiense TaxID=1365924 RepID=A0ABS4TFH7_9PSEU|nr:hypothetical protein [Kibdelosporangium banguiense]MBP2322628.1 hypothetical protein [Kibdelosporangium banguiense]
MKRLRAGLVTAVLVAVTIQILWWTVEPLLPYLLLGLVLVVIFGTIYYRSTRW